MLFNGSPKEVVGGTIETYDLKNLLDLKLEVISPNQVPPENLAEPEIKRPGFMVYDDWFFN